MTFRAVDSFSPISRAEYSLDAGDWQTVDPVGKISDYKIENYDFNVPITATMDEGGIARLRARASSLRAAEEHTLVIRVYDRFENMGISKSVVKGGGGKRLGSYWRRGLALSRPQRHSSMNPREVVDLFASLACSVYGTIPLFWLAVHPFVERWRASGRRAYAFIVPVWAGFIAIAFLLMWPFRSVHFYTNWFAWAPAAIFFLVGFSVYRAAFTAIRPRPGFRLGRTGAAPPSPATDDNRHSLTRAPSYLSGPSLRDYRLVHRNRIGRALRSGDLRHDHWRGDDPHGRPRTGGAVWGSLSCVSRQRVPGVLPRFEGIDRGITRINNSGSKLLYRGVDGRPE